MSYFDLFLKLEPWLMNIKTCFHFPYFLDKIDVANCYCDG